MFFSWNKAVISINACTYSLWRIKDHIILRSLFLRYLLSKVTTWIHFFLVLGLVDWKTLDADIKFSIYWLSTWFSLLNFRFSSFTLSTLWDKSSNVFWSSSTWAINLAFSSCSSGLISGSKLLGLQLPFVNVDGIESMLCPLPSASDMWQLLSKISSSGIITCGSSSASGMLFMSSRSLSVIDVDILTRRMLYERNNTLPSKPARKYNVWPLKFIDFHGKPTRDRCHVCWKRYKIWSIVIP